MNILITTALVAFLLALVLMVLAPICKNHEACKAQSPKEKEGKQ